MTDTTGLKVVVNHEEQYSIAPVDQKLSGTWREASEYGTQKQCLQYIEEVWKNMTPLITRTWWQGHLIDVIFRQRRGYSPLRFSELLTD